MIRQTIRKLNLLLFAISVVLLCALSARAQSCEGLAKLANIMVTSATTVDGSHFVVPHGLEAAAQGLPDAFERQAGAARLPNFCRVRLTLAPAIKVEVWLPTEGWNGDFEGVGNGGKAGSMSYPAMATALKGHFATASTDTGHEGSEDDTKWAYHNPELVTDFSYLAIHEMTTASMKVIKAFYGKGPRYSYFDGCSTGGRQGLMEAQRYPDDYNGIVSGAPVIDYTHLQVAHFWLALRAQKDPETYFPPDKLPAINRASVAACDAIDGLKDGLIDDPRKCNFDLAVLRCKGADSPSCLTTKQVQTLQDIYRGVYAENGEEIYPGFMPGHETAWDFIEPADPSKPLSDDAGVGAVGFFKYFVFENSKWDFHTWSNEKDMPIVDKKLAAKINGTNPNLRPFEAHGGKLILYHGWTDPGVSPLETIQYYTQVTAAAGGDGRDPKHQTDPAPHPDAVSQTADFMRLFMIPGMDHCEGGPGPNMFDAFTPLTKWVEQGQAPERIVASHYTNGKVDRTRPLCPYPRTSQYTGQGSTDDAANFVCRMPGK